MKKIDIIVGIRPDFIRASALVHTFQDYEDKLDIRIIHTGQHYDPELSQNILDQFPLTSIYAHLDFNVIEGIGKLASIMMSYENQIRIDKPDLVLVIGNSDSALACSLVAARAHIQVGHLDAGIRSYDKLSAEEQNDMLIDKLASYLFTSNEEAVINLIREGYENQNIVEVGNIRADAVFTNLGYAEDSEVLDRLGLEKNAYILVTLHHDHILNNIDFLSPFFIMLEKLSERLRIVVVLHPKTLQLLEDMPEIILDPGLNLQFVSSQNYHDMLKLIKYSVVVLTDSQGIQEESSILGVQCLTLGHTTNRPVSLSKGTNTLMGFNVQEMESKIISIIEGDTIDGFPIDGWEGKAGQRIARFLIEMD
ncbi:MAG: UDP-N-acetylglucosamine 2-epimerase (non-hydrolyzing) [Candidatus Marinimicrobia bacterium]|nr:UDP-N-acetylglucosamine 2-epimerase (non-hydrolyzing) [Candidatus Neomarinimicrobiota bacterium]